MKVSLIREENPEVAAAKIATASRALTPIDQVKMSPAQAAAFHQKWTVGARHVPIADHAVVQLAIEGVTRLALVALEEARLAGFMETSTRYIKFGPKALFAPSGLGSSLERDFQEAGLNLFETYGEFIPQVRERVLSRYPRRGGESERSWKTRLHHLWIDVCRFLLPRATLVNDNMTSNARELAHTVGKMQVHYLPEVRQLALTILDLMSEGLPSLKGLVKSAEYRVKIRDILKAAVKEFGWEPEVPRGPYVDLVVLDGDPEVNFLSLCLYPVSELSLRGVQERVREFPEKRRLRLLQDILLLLTPTQTIRALEALRSDIFDICIDWGAFYDLKRHRMCTLIPQENGIELGFLVPRVIEELGFRPHYEAAIRAAEEVYRSIAASVSSEVAEYLSTNAHLKRFLMGMNLREALYVTWLRSGRGGHFSYRWVAARMFELASQVYPTLMSCGELRSPPSEKLAEEHFASMRRGG